MLEDREHAIRERAYAIWERHGRPDGRSLAHWSQAEAEIGTELADAVVVRKRIRSRNGRTAAKRTA
jgi:hypothetical protein